MYHLLAPCRISWALAVMLMLCPALASAQVINKIFEESDGPAINPDCGWVAYNYEDSYATRMKAAGGKKPFALASVVYTRHPMKSWVNAVGDYDDSAPLTLLEDWIHNGRHVAFRIYANDLADLPATLQGRVPLVKFQRDGRPASGIVYWDDAYIAEHHALVKFLGKRIGNSPFLAFVDIGGVGNTGGEWFFEDRPAYSRTGLSDERMYELIETFVKMYRAAFPKTRLFIAYDCVVQAGIKREEAIAFLMKNNIGIRDDGLGGWPFPRTTPQPDWPIPTFWRKTPVLFEGSGRGGGVYGWGKQEKDARRILD